MAGWKDVIPKTERRNFCLFTIDGTFFYLSQALFEPSVLVPAFISHLTSSPFLIGLGTTVRNAGWFLPQVFVAGYVETRPFRRPLVLAGGLVHALALLFIIPAVLLLEPVNNWATLAAFLFLYSLSSAGEGVVGVPWMDMVGKCIGPTRRGRLMGYMQAMGGLSAFGAGGVVAWVLSREWLEFPCSYMVLVFLSSMALMGIVACMYLLREPPGEARSGQLRLRHYLEGLPAIVRANPGLKSFLITKVLGNLYMLCVPFYVTYARNELLVPDSMMGAFIGVQMLGNMGGSILLGYLGDTFGNRLVILLAMFSTMTAPGVGLFLTLAAGSLPSGVCTGLLLVVYFSLGMTFSGMWMGFQNYILELVEPKIRPTCIGLGNSLVAPVSFTPLLGGYLVASLGYSWLFGLTALMVASGLCMSLRLPEPRARKA
ncbi:MAG: MFS transporter [Bacillota bacterium]